MSVVKRIASNTTALYVSQIVVAILSFVVTIFLARELGSAILGKYSFAGSLTAIFAIFLNLGFDTLIVREVARDKSLASKYIGNIITIKMMLSIIVFGVIVGIIKTLNYPQDTTTAVLILGVAIVLNAFSAVFMQTFMAFERMWYNTIVSITSQIVIVALSLGAIFLGYGLIEIVSAVAIGSLFRIVLSFILCRRKFVKPRIEVDFSFWRKMARSALPLAMIPIAAIICIRTDTIMLSIMKGDEVVGWYNAANGIPLALTNVPWLFMSALLPFMSASFISLKSSLRTTYEMATKYLFIVGCAIAVGLYLLSDRVVLFFYGPEFQPSIIAFQILSWRLFLSFLGTALSFTLISMNREKQIAMIVGISAGANVALNLILIPPLGLAGASITTLVSGTITVASYYYLVSKHLVRLPIRVIAVKPLIACSLMGVLLYWGRGINLFLLIGLAATLYFGLLYLLKTFSEEDKKIIREIAKMFKGRLVDAGRFVRGRKNST